MVVLNCYKMYKLRCFWGGVLMLLSMVAVAQDKHTQLEHLRSEMYRLYSVDSLQRFMDVTTKLKDVNEDYTI